MGVSSRVSDSQIDVVPGLIYVACVCSRHFSVFNRLCRSEIVGIPTTTSTISSVQIFPYHVVMVVVDLVPMMIDDFPHQFRKVEPFDPNIAKHNIGRPMVTW